MRGADVLEYLPDAQKGIKKTQSQSSLNFTTYSRHCYLCVTSQRAIFAPVFHQVQILGGVARAPCSKWGELRVDAAEAVSPSARRALRRGHKGATVLIFCCFFLFSFGTWLFLRSSSINFLIIFEISTPGFLPGQLFLKEDVYQLLECKRERTRQLAALTLQRYARMFFIRKRFVAFRGKIVALQARCRGFLARSAAPASAVWA